MHNLYLDNVYFNSTSHLQSSHRDYSRVRDEDEWPQEYLQFLIDHFCVYIFREFRDVIAACHQEALWVVSPLYNDNDRLVFIFSGQFLEYR